MINTAHWNKFYKKFKLLKPSNFSKFIFRKLKNFKTIFDIGCGNGRDTIFFLSKNKKCYGVDNCSQAIKLNKKKYKQAFHKFNFCSDKTLLKKIKIRPDLIYARFFIHSINVKQENIFLKNCFKLLKKKGKVALEFRTIKDPLMKKGKKLSYNERIYTHYRRFIDTKFLKEKIIKNNFKIIYSKESFNFAKFSNERPHIARIIFQKS
tara:strand:+ start:88 stop:708 length:621 start_codon:yes stop_codon:yes gene_type:complete